MAAETEKTFGRDQLIEYFDHIELPKKYYDENTPPDLSLLTALHIHQIAAIPYENLSLHYSPDKTVSLDPQILYGKFVTRGRHRGGYCMEGSLFFLHVLRSLGFRAYPSAVRIRLREDGVPSGDYIALTHIVLIIELPQAGGQGAGEGQAAAVDKYVCDVAFGGDGPTVPMPLRDGVVTRNLGAQEIRLAHERLPRSVHKFWVYQYRNGPAKPWNSFYAFTDSEFLEADFGSINYFTSQAPTFQKTTVIIVKFLLGPDEATGEDKVAGKVMLVNGVVKRNMGGKTEVVAECSTEKERLEAIKKWFGIDFSDEEIAGIKNSITELKPVEVVTV